MAEKRQIVIHVEAERVDEQLTVGEYLGVQNGNFTSIVSMCSKFLWDNEQNVYYSLEEARRILAKLKIGELKALVKTIEKEMQDQAVPPELEDASTPD